MGATGAAGLRRAGRDASGSGPRRAGPGLRGDDERFADRRPVGVVSGAAWLPTRRVPVPSGASPARPPLDRCGEAGEPTVGVHVGSDRPGAVHALDRRDQRTVIAAGHVEHLRGAHGRPPHQNPVDPAGRSPRRMGGPDGAATNPASTSTGATARASRFRSPAAAPVDPPPLCRATGAPPELGDRDPGSVDRWGNRPPTRRRSVDSDLSEPSSASRATRCSPPPGRRDLRGLGTRPRGQGDAVLSPPSCSSAGANRTRGPSPRRSPHLVHPAGPSRCAGRPPGRRARPPRIRPEGVGQASGIRTRRHRDVRGGCSVQATRTPALPRRGDLRLRSDGSWPTGSPPHKGRTA